MGKSGQSARVSCRGGAYDAPRLFAAIEIPSSPQATRASQTGHGIFSKF